jgi:hypothetical protein
VLPGAKPGTAENVSNSAAVKCDAEIADFRDCHEKYPTGCTKNGSAYDPFLNELKNQVTWGAMNTASIQPKEVITTIDRLNQLELQIQKIGLEKGNHAAVSDKLKDIGEGSVFGVVGYLYAVEPEGAESSNCQLAKDPPDYQDVDYHIFIGFDPAVGKKLQEGHAITSAEKHQSMVVEMTPHYREAFHTEWSVKALKDVIGQQVRVLGQLMVDNEHFVPGQDCGIDPSKEKCWRASVWELHPVVDFRVCDAGSCSATSVAGWTPIGESTKNASASEGTPAKSPTRGNNP